MLSLISYTHCPVCTSGDIKKSLIAKDYTVSQESFEVWHCGHCSLRFTQHIPDANAIAKYYQSSAYISHSDTQEGLVNKLYHFVRNHTLKTKRKLVEQAAQKNKGSLLDVGAGTGAFSHAMQTAGWNITALEPDDGARKTALEKYKLQLQHPEELYQLSAKQFDAVTMWHVLEHVHDLHGYLKCFHSVLKDDGVLIIAVPNYTSHDAKHYAESWAAYDVPRHLYHFSPASMQKLASVEGFTVKEYKPMWFDSFYVSMLSEQYKNGKGNLIGAFFTALISNIKAFSNSKKCSSVIYVMRKS
jgi:2-polyprenyl-3-methyl-5-hydroxy-6-metoxy-1,4-benzoquinol methylase